MQALCCGTNAFHLSGNGLHRVPEPFERALLGWMKNGQLKMIYRRFCGLQDKDVPIFILGMINMGSPFSLRECIPNGGPGCKVDG